jgi:hypothetical protein
MISPRQVIIRDITDFLGNSSRIHVIDWHPGTGAVIIDDRAPLAPQTRCNAPTAVQQRRTAHPRCDLRHI